MSIPDSLVSQILSAVLQASVPTTTLLYDTFTGADGTALPAHAPEVGGPWVAGAQSMQLHSNTAARTNTFGTDSVDLHTNRVDVTVHFQLGHADGANQVQVDVSNDGAAYGIITVVQGTGTMYVDVYAPTGEDLTEFFSWTADTNPHTLRVASDGQVVSVWLDGTLKSQVLIPGWFVPGTNLTLRVDASAGVYTSFADVLAIAG